MRTVHNPEDIECNLVSRELEIVPPNESRFQYNHVHINSLEDAVFIVVVIPATSFLVSGSVVVVGNVVHWVEKQGKCEESAINSFTSDINDTITEAGGKIIESSSEFIDWLQSL